MLFLIFTNFSEVLPIHDILHKEKFTQINIHQLKTPCTVQHAIDALK